MRLRRFEIAWISVSLILSLAGVACVIGWRRHQADPAPFFLRAETAYREGRLDEAAAALDRLAQLRTPTSVDRYLRAQVDVGKKQDERALAELAAIPDDHPLAPMARLRTGQIEIRLGRARPAEAAFLATLKLLPRAVQPHKELVYIYNIQHRQAELDAQLLALLELNQLDFQIVLHWTKTRNTNWKPGGDLPALQKFVAADPLDRWSRLALVDAFYRLNRLDEADEILGTMSASDPLARAKRIAIAIDRGEFSVAESLLALGDGSSHELARLSGQLALKSGNGRAAVKFFRVALAGDPFDRVALYGLGTALRQVGENDAAEPFIEAASRHDELWRLVARASTPDGENDPQMPHQLGMACAAAGRYQEARAWLKLAIERDPLDAAGQRMLYQLEHNALPASANESVKRPVGARTIRSPGDNGGSALRDPFRESERPDATKAARMGRQDLCSDTDAERDRGRCSISI
jgi:tetratricopeptide (TPR) repeat protein